MSNDDIIAGWQLSVTMQRRTPLAWLLRHGEFHEGSDRPREIVPMQHACWVPVTRSWRSLGIEVDETRETTMASEIGQIPVNGGDFLPFLIEYRMIVEHGGGTLTDLASRYPQYRELLFPSSKRPRAATGEPYPCYRSRSEIISKFRTVLINITSTSNSTVPIAAATRPQA